jgi:hypothetical protein
MPIACTVCKTISPESKIAVPGSTAIEVLLWLLFFPVAIIYGIWRSNATKEVCPACHSAFIVPLETPMGQEIRCAQSEVHFG